MTDPQRQSEGAPHGTISGYFNHGCRCDACRKAGSEYMKDRRRRAAGYTPGGPRMPDISPRKVPGERFTEWQDGEATPLGNTIAKPGQGVAGHALFKAGWYPACSLHGAMNRVAPQQLWRCLACNIGVEIKP